MRISVLMSNYNKCSYIKEAIESVLRQSYDDWELIILDDFSDDNSLEIIDSFSNNKRIKIFRNEKKEGTIGLLKKMISHSSGNIFLILDSDDTLEKDTLKEVSDVFEKHPDIGYVYSQCNYCDADLRPYKIGSKKISENKSNIHGNKIVALRSFRKDSYNKTSGFDPECIFAEDYDMTLKLEEVTKIFFIEKVLYNYRILKKSQTHGFTNEMINKSSVALAKFKAYKRRLGRGIINLKRVELFEVLIWGFISSAIAFRFNLLKIFALEIFKRIYVFLYPVLYYLIIRKIIKITLFKTNKI